MPEAAVALALGSLKFRDDGKAAKRELNVKR